MMIRSPNKGGLAALLAAFALAVSVGPARGQVRGRALLETITVVTGTGDSVQAELGRLSVPEDYRQPAGTRITLAFLRFRGMGAGAPLLYLAGGPGASGTAAIHSRRASALLARRAQGDVILFDQRGTGMSDPALDCPEPFSYPLDQRVDADVMTAAYRRFARSCAASWRDRGVDLARYNTEASADDIQSLADAIGMSQLQLLGSSYGTHLALAVMRRHPTLVNRAVLIGPEGPDHTLKLPRQVDAHLQDLSRLFAADSASARELPDFRGQLGTLVARLRNSPVRATVYDSVRHDTVGVVVSAFDALAIAAGLIGRSATIAQIPRIFGPAMRGALSPLAELVPEMSRRAEISAMSAAMDCASSSSPQRRQEVSRQAETTVLGTMVDFPNPQWCEAWGVSPLSEAFRTPVRATMPVLIIAGTLDGLTPVQNARDVLRGLTHGALITVVGGAHDNLADDSRVSRLITEFLMGGRARDTTISLPQIRFEPRVAGGHQ